MHDNSTWTHGKKRQFEAGEQALKDFFASQGVKKYAVDKVGEIKSGSLPLHKRNLLMDLLTDPKVHAIGVENTRALSRRMLYGELIYEISKVLNKRIIPRDMPGIFDHNPHPNQAYPRRAVLNAQEFEKDSIYHRTSKALCAKKEEMLERGDKMRKTQDGDAKVNGRLSVLEMTKPSASLRKKLVTQCQRRSKGKFGWRTLASKLSTLLDLEKPISHEAARRLSASLGVKE